MKNITLELYDGPVNDTINTLFGSIFTNRIENPDHSSYQRDWDETKSAYGSVTQCK